MAELLDKALASALAGPKETPAPAARANKRKVKELNRGDNAFYAPREVNGVKTNVLASRLCVGLRAAVGGDAFSTAIITLHSQAQVTDVAERVLEDELPGAPPVWAQAEACVHKQHASYIPP